MKVFQHENYSVAWRNKTHKSGRSIFGLDNSIDASRRTKNFVLVPKTHAYRSSMGKLGDLFRWKPKKRRSAAQNHSLGKAQIALAQDDEDATSDKENTGVDVAEEMARLEERAQRYEKGYRNERKKGGQMSRHLEAAKQTLQNVISSQDTIQDCLHEAQAQLELKEREVSQLKENKERLEKRNGGLHTRISRASHQKEKAVEKAVETEQKRKTMFHVQEKGVITETPRAMMRNLLAWESKPRVSMQLLAA
jgi:chromosome segregation ATPase